MKLFSQYTIHVLIVVLVVIVLSIFIVPSIDDCNFIFLPYKDVKLGSLLAFYPILSLISERFTQLLISARSMNKQKADKLVRSLETSDSNNKKLDEPKTFGNLPLSAGSVQEVKDQIQAYSRKTFRYATIISFLTCVLLCLFGFRVLSTFVTFDEASCAFPGYITFFHTMDIVLSAALLAGTSDGIHQLTEMLKKNTTLTIT